MKSNFIITLFFLTYFCQAQNTNDKKTLLDSIGKFTKGPDFVFYEIIEDYKLNKPSYRLVRYNKNNAVVMEGTISSKITGSKEGEFTYYYDNGIKAEVINYKASHPNGKYEQWYPTGNKKRDGIYLPAKDGEKETLILNNFWNKENIQTLIDGNGTYEENIAFTYNTFSQINRFTTYNKLGLQKGDASGTAKNGKKDGKWTGEFPNIKLSFVEEYKNGKFVEGIATDSIGKQTKYTEIEENRFIYNGGLEKFYQYVKKNFILPNTVNKDDIPPGKIYAQLTIKIDGTADDIKIIRSPTEALNNDVIRIIKNFQGWVPSKTRGQNTNNRILIPIPIPR